MPLFQNESVQNLSYETDFDLHENELEGGAHFHVNGFTRRLVLTQRQNASGIALCYLCSSNVCRIL